MFKPSLCSVNRSDDKLDRSTVKNLIGRSQSIKVSVPKTEGGGSSTDVRRAISFRQRADAPLSPVSLQKAAEFRPPSTEEAAAAPQPQSPAATGEVLSEEEDDAPQLPHAPPPMAVAGAETSQDTGRSTSPTYAKKGGLSPPLSPTQKRIEQASPVSVTVKELHVVGSCLSFRVDTIKSKSFVLLHRANLSRIHCRLVKIRCCL